MELKIIKKSIYSVPDYSKKLNVAAYIRVSTENENQIFSFESQIKYYNNLISKNANWCLVDLYADYGLSGTNVNKRKEFQRMINDALDGKIDLIITKSISRFSRNSENLLSFVRMLRNHNVAVYFEEEKIYTLNMESEFLLSVLASVAEQESINTSEHIKQSFRQYMQNGGLITGKKRYGYDIVNGNIVINKKEAKIIKKIFEMYISGIKSGDIAKCLNQKRVPTINGAKWSRGRIRDYLINEIYVGDLLQGKCKNIRVNGHIKQVRNKDGEKILIRDHHEPIISREMFEKARQLLNKRNTQKNKTVNLFPNKLNCGFCGGSLTVSQTKNQAKYYKCCNKKTKKCIAKMTREDIIINSFQQSIIKLLKEKNKEANFIDYKNLLQSKTSIENKMNIVLNKQSSLTDSYMNKLINTGKYKYEQNSLEDKLVELNNDKDKIEFEIEKHNDIIKSLKRLYLTLENEFDKNSFNIDFFNKIIQKVIIGGISEKGTKLPHLIRFIYSDKEKLFSDGLRMQGKQYIDNNDKTIIILRFRYKHSYLKMQKNKPSAINSSLVQFEIER